MTLSYDIVQGILTGALPSGTTSVHFVDTWTANEAMPSIVGDTACADTDVTVTCNMSWESYFTTNGLFGNPAGVHHITAQAKNSGGTTLGTYNYNLTVPSYGLPILALNAPLDAETHDAIYAINPGVDPTYLQNPAYLQQPAGTYLNLPTAGFTLQDRYTSSAIFDDPKIQVSNGKVYCLTDTTLGGGIEIGYRTIGDHSSPWTHLVFGSALISQFGGAGTVTQNEGGDGFQYTFKVDADGGIWVSLMGNLIGNPSLINHIVHLPAGSSTWQVVYSDQYRNAKLFFAGPKKTIPSFFTEPYNPMGQPGFLAMWNGVDYTYMADTTLVGDFWVQYTYAPAIAYNSTSMFVYVPDLVVSGQLNFYYLSDIETLGPYNFPSVGGAGAFGDTNLWPTSINVSIMWNIGMLASFMSEAWIGASFDDTAFNPSFEIPGTEATTLTLVPSILTPPTGSQFGAFPVVLLNSTTSFATAYQTGTMVETSDNYILCYLTL